MLLQRFAEDFASEDGSLASSLMRRESDPYATAAEFLQQRTLRESQGARHEPDARSKIA
jgi:hypothetical protein